MNLPSRDKHSRLVEALYSKTLNNELRWEVIGEAAFKVEIGDVQVRVSSIHRETDRESEDDIDIDIFDILGNPVDSFSDTDLSGMTPSVEGFQYYFPLMKELHRIAGRNATGADAIIDKILNILGD